MNIVSWNVNGLRSVHRNGYWAGFLKLHADIYCLQETKATPEQLPDDIREVPGFHSYFNSSQTKKGYSGVAMYSKRQPLDVSYDLPDEITTKHNLDSDTYGVPNKEGRVLTAEFPEFFLVTVYTPNTKDDLSRLQLRHKHWDPAFLEYCVHLQAKKPVVFCGDLNVAHAPVDLAHPKENEGKKGFTKEEREGIDNMLDEGFVDTFRMFTQEGEHYTWWSPWAHSRERNVGWRIDYVFAGDQLKHTVQNARIHPDVYGSDHCPVSVTLDL